MNDLTEKGASEAGIDAFKFQQKRRRPDGHFNYPITGFGAQSGPAYTFWVLSPAAKTVRVFEYGKRVTKSIPCQLDDEPRIRELRDSVLVAYHADAVSRTIRLPLAFEDYAVAILQRSYHLNDEDLTMLLSGTKWHDAVFQHLIGGEDLVRRFLTTGSVLAETDVPASLRPRDPLTAGAVEPSPPPGPVANDSEPPAKRRRWFSRWRDRH